MASVRKRVRARVGRAPLVNWIADYKDGSGKRHMKTCAAKKEAQTWLAETLVAVKRGTHTPAHQSITIAEASRRWLDHCRAEQLEPHTLRSYESLVRRHLVPSIGNRRLAQLNGPTLEGWRDNLLTGTATHQPCSRVLARKVIGALKSILTLATKHGLVGHNAAQDLEIKLDKRAQKKLTIGDGLPSKAHIQALLTTARGRHRALLVTAIFTGMRASELRGLAWDAVDLDRRIITVRQRADERGVIGPPKSPASRRAIPLSPIVCNTLGAWREECPASRLGLVFPTERGRPLPHTRLVSRVWRPLQRRAGLVDGAGAPLFNFHALRHFAAALWIEAGFSPKRMQALLGHGSIQMTFDVYGHLFPSAEQDHDRLARAEAVLRACAEPDRLAAPGHAAGWGGLAGPVPSATH